MFAGGQQLGEPDFRARLRVSVNSRGDHVFVCGMRRVCLGASCVGNHVRHLLVGDVVAGERCVGFQVRCVGRFQRGGGEDEEEEVDAAAAFRSNTPG